MIPAIDWSSMRSTEAILAEALTQVGQILLQAGQELESNALIAAERKPPRKADPNEIINLVSRRVAYFMDITPSEIGSRSRSAKYVRPRQFCWYILSKTTELSLKSLAAIYGDFDHTTVIAAIKRADQLLKENGSDFDWVYQVLGEVESLGNP